ncbi:ubiquitin-conjugating enzyme E2 27-like [Asparagus officinalis]|nr:ubiquitin-conjugating enzyme E2 27-like [Asparagus officinalis]
MDPILAQLCKGEGNDLAQLEGTIPGPVGTPYEGGIFHIDIQLPGNYPFEPPQMKFSTKVWHPNICHQSGAVSLSAEFYLEGKWNPTVTLQNVLLSLQALLSRPAPYGPQADKTVSDQLTKNYSEFCNHARNWTEAFAKTTAPVGLKEQRLVEMGFPEARVKRVLEEVDGDEKRALERLTSNKHQKIHHHSS